MKRIFLIVLDSLGIGYLPDADLYGDVGANTLKSVCNAGDFSFPNLKKLGLFNIDDITYATKEETPIATHGRLMCKSKGKDTTIGHFEIAGYISEEPFPTFPNGFPKNLLDEISKKIGRNFICNKPYSGTEVINDFGEQHIKTGDLILYTSADSVFQIAAHEEIVPIKELYKYCEIARELLKDEYAVARVIARPFIGEPNNFKRTSNRHDFSLAPKDDTVLDMLNKNGFDTLGIGKIYDIFAGKGISKTTKTTGNTDGINQIYKHLDYDFNGLCFINLVDFDMLYGHRNDALGYATALKEFDDALPNIINKMRDDDVLILTADHGCDPNFKGTDHSREYVFYLNYCKNNKNVENIGTKDSFTYIADFIKTEFNLI